VVDVPKPFRLEQAAGARTPWTSTYLPNTFLEPTKTAPGEISGGRFHQLDAYAHCADHGNAQSQSWPARPRAILEADLACGSAFGINTVHALSTCELARAYIASRAAYSASATASNAKSIASYA
jgi:hypothetical protein